MKKQKIIGQMIYPKPAIILEPIGVYRPEVDKEQFVVNAWSDGLGFTEKENDTDTPPNANEGKVHIHSGSTGGSRWGGALDTCLESMAEARKSARDYPDGNILYINIMNWLSVDCDCKGISAKPDMHIIGMLVSYNPVVLDKDVSTWYMSQRTDSP